MDHERQANRREFLRGKAAFEAIAQIESPAESHAAPEELPADSYQVRVSRRAMACAFEVFLNAGQFPQGSETALAALDLVDRLEDQLSVYREQSEVSRLNRDAPLAPVTVEPQLFAVLERAVALHRETAGAFDVTCGQLSKVWGFTARRGRVPRDEEIEETRARIGSEHLALDPRTSSVSIKRPGVEINLGGIGKGYALDRVAGWMLASGVDQFLLHGGSSSVVARGTQGTPGVDEGWLVGLRNPLFPVKRLGQIRLVNRALGTSGSGTQFFLHEGKRYGHILDPRTGRPAEGVLTATAIAHSGAEADALATAFYVMGPQAVATYCREHPGVAAVLVCPGERAGSVVTHVCGLAAGEWRNVAGAQADEATPN